MATKASFASVGKLYDGVINSKSSSRVISANNTRSSRLSRRSRLYVKACTEVRATDAQVCRWPANNADALLPG
eukprot:283112-Prorocentrum_minimum.AAC.3